MNDNLVTLNRLPIGKKGRIFSIETTGSQRRRMQDLGLSGGTIVEALHQSPSGDPVAYFVRGTVIALRREDAEKIILTVPA